MSIHEPTCDVSNHQKLPNNNTWTFMDISSLCILLLVSDFGSTWVRLTHSSLDFFSFYSSALAKSWELILSKKVSLGSGPLKKVLKSFSFSFQNCFWYVNLFLYFAPRPSSISGQLSWGFGDSFNITHPLYYIDLYRNFLCVSFLKK